MIDIKQYASSVEQRIPQRNKSKVETVIRKKDLFVPLDRMNDLISLVDAQEKGIIKGNIQVINRKASRGEMKAIKRPGHRGWWALPEWLEEYNNGWANQHFHEKIRA